MIRLWLPILKSSMISSTMWLQLPLSYIYETCVQHPFMILMIEFYDPGNIYQPCHEGHQICSRRLLDNSFGPQYCIQRSPKPRKQLKEPSSPLDESVGTPPILKFHEPNPKPYALNNLKTLWPRMQLARACPAYSTAPAPIQARILLGTSSVSSSYQL